ncbi:MAG: 2'-5' RNA ligase family protein [Methanosarcina sp.]
MKLNCRFELKSKRAIAHITLIGPFSTDNEIKLIRYFNHLCSKNSLMNFEIYAIGTFDNIKVVYFNVNPSREMNEFRWALARKLKSYCQFSQYDYEREYKFHATIAMKLPDEKFIDIKDFLKRKGKLNFDVTIIKIF